MLYFLSVTTVMKNSSSENLEQKTVGLDVCSFGIFRMFLVNSGEAHKS